MLPVRKCILGPAGGAAGHAGQVQGSVDNRGAAYALADWQCVGCAAFALIRPKCQTLTLPDPFVNFTPKASRGAAMLRLRARTATVADQRGQAHAVERVGCLTRGAGDAWPCPQGRNLLTQEGGRAPSSAAGPGNTCRLSATGV